MMLEIIVFIILFLFVFLGGHWLIFYSLKTFFRLDGPAKYALMGLIFALPPCFIILSALTRKSDAAAVHWLYLFASGWMGVAIYLVPGFSLAWLAHFFAKRRRRPLRGPCLAGTVLGLTALIAAYGFANARLIAVRSFDVAVSGLPPEWQGKRILQLSDVHLGSINRTEYLERIISLASELSPDYIFLTGDYLDGTCPRADKFIAPLGRLSAAAKVYFINGNHETYARVGDLRGQLASAGVALLADEIVLDNGVQIAGLDYTHDRKNPAGKITIADLSPDYPAILLSHEPVLAGDARAAGVDLHLSGHTHRGQLFPAGLVTRLIYGQRHYGLSREGSYAQYTSAGAGTWGPPMRVLTKSEVALFTLSRATD